MSTKARSLEPLEARIGYRFSDPVWLEKALTHSSAVSPARRNENSYQRLEFLGDRVLGLVIADMLRLRLPKANEGDLSRALNALVRKETCADVAMALNLGSHLRLGDSERRSGGARKMAILADVCEAVIGAVYCDGGFSAAAKFVQAQFGDLIDPETLGRNDAKTALQEWAQARGLEPPTYEEVNRLGPDHAPSFEVAVNLAGFKPAEAQGPSKKVAEHQAAEKFLRREKIWRQAE